jgi:predicted nicotinamide N-methyase
MDSDGDLQSYSLAKDSCLIKLEHQMRTKLADVGLQLWRASFYLSDFILNNVNLFKNKIVIDLGTGLGLTSFVTSLISDLV